MADELDGEPGADHWFEPIAEHLGSAYLRYSFTKGTVQEVDHVVAALGLQPGSGCSTSGAGPGATPTSWPGGGSSSTASTSPRRFVELARRDAPAGATFERLDARTLPFDGEFDAAICLCQGAFGLMTADGEDGAVLAGIARALRPGGRLALSAFNAYFAVRYHDGGDVRRRPRRRPRAHRGPRPRRRGRSRSTCGPAATRPASCACCSTATASPSSASAASSPAPTATTRRRPSRPSSWSSPVADDGQRHSDRPGLAATLVARVGGRSDRAPRHP